MKGMVMMPSNALIKNITKKKLGKTLRRAFESLSAITLLLTGCTMVGPDYVKPPVPEPQEWLESTDSKIESKAADFNTWWTVFNDPILNNLVETAYQQNLPLQVAGIRILEARAQLGIAIGFQYPQQQQAGGSATVNQISKNAPNAAFAERSFYDYQAGFDAAWELDFWGKFRRAVQSGFAGLEASIAGYDGVLVSLTAETARTYMLIRTLEEQLAVAYENVRIQKRSLEIVEVRFKAGAVTELDVSQATALLKSTETSIPLLESELRQVKNALAVLLGKLPGEIDAMLGAAGPIPRAPAEVAVGIPAELLRRRPDIRLAERRLAAQSALIGVAKADLYPRFSLFGSIGFETTGSTGRGSNNAGLSDMFDSESLTYFAGPAINWDLFNYGRITNRVRVEDARFQELAVNYQNTVLIAFKEVEDAMAAFLRAKEAVAFLAVGVKASMRAVELSMLQYREGLVDYQRVLDAQRFLSDQQDFLVQIAGSVAVNLVAIYKALGGGWQLREGQEFVSAKIREEMEHRTDWDKLSSPDTLQTPPAEDVDKLFHRPDW
jgi:NodT family efflux transporter outer membrane factor (OMF) lipoprotein